MKFLRNVLSVGTAAMLLVAPAAASDLATPLSSQTKPPHHRLAPEPGIFALIGTAGFLLLFRRRSPR